MLFLPFLHFFCCVSYFYLAIYIISQNPKQKLNQACAATFICFLVWSGSLIFVFNEQNTAEQIRLIYCLGSLGWIPFGSCFLWFCAILTEQKKILKSKLFYAAIFLPPTILIYQQFQGNILKYFKETEKWFFVWQNTAWTYLFFLTYLSCVLGGVILIHRYRQTIQNQEKRKQLKEMLVVILVGVIAGTITNIIAPLLKLRQVPELGNVVGLFWAVGVVYFMAKYKFLAITPAQAAGNIIETIEDALFLLDENKKISFANNRLLTLLGYSRKEIEGEELKKIFPQEVQGLQYKKIFANNSNKDENFLYLAKNGKTIPVLFSSSPVNIEGELKGVVCLAKQAKNRKLAEEKLKASEEKFGLLFENAPDLIYLSDLSGTFVAGNFMTQQITGFKKEELIGKNVFQIKLFLAKDTPRVLSMIQQNAQGKPAGPNEITLFNKEGKKIQLELSTFPYSAENKKLVLGIARDITQRKEAEKKLQNAYQTLKETQEQLIQSSKMAAMGQLAAGISHELNQPLTGIKGFSQAALMDLKPEDPLRADLEKIIEQTNRMDAIIKNVRFFGRKALFEKKTININDPVENAIMLVNEQIKAHNIKLIKELAQDLPIIQADTNQLQQVMLNFITNARDALDSKEDSSDEKTLKIKTQLSEDKNSIIIIFEDNGCGISQENQEYIFNPFFTTKSPDGGMGLGLSIVFQIIKSHGGRITLQSKVKEGTTFKIFLPLNNV